MRGWAWLCLLSTLAQLTAGCSIGAEGGGPGGAGSDAAAIDAPVPVDAVGTGPASDGGDSEDAADATVNDSPPSPPGDGASGPCPPLMAWIEAEAGAACIDLYEGALVHLEGDGGEVPWPHFEPIDGYDAGEFRAVPAAGTFPQGYISQVQATEACRASGKRLCTFDEWTSACRGRPQHDYVYPYGDTYEAGRCNEGKESPIVLLFGPNPTYSAAELNDPRCDQLEGGLAQGGAYAECESAYGAFDMHGNVHEWIDDTTATGEGVFLGGYFVDAKLNGPGCTYATTAHAETYHDYSTGFRCCADVGAGGG
jgi:sulfatase modifying factor 1